MWTYIIRRTLLLIPIFLIISVVVFSLIHMVPGDPIVGHITPGKGFVLHIETCRNMNEVRNRSAKEIIPAHWAEKVDGEFLTTLRVEVSRKKGVIAEIAATITATDAGVEDVRIQERSAALTSMAVRVSVRNRDHLARTMRKLRVISSVQSIARMSL